MLDQSRFNFSTVVIFIFMAPTLCRADINSSDYFKVTTDSLFNQPVKAVFQKLVDNRIIPDARNPYKATKKNHFCVIGYKIHESSGEVDKAAQVYWKEGRAIISWDPTVPDMRDGVDDLTMSRRYIRFDKDIVATENDLHGSTYLETTAWVDHIINDCHQYGEEFTITSHRK